MEVRHWSDNELIARLYGAAQDDGHVEQCEECTRRWRQLQAVRLSVLAEPHVPPDLLARQRRAVYLRLENPAAYPWQIPFAPAVAVMMMILVAIVLSRPAPSPEPARASSEAQLISDVYSVVQSSEPNATAPIQGLFEVKQ